MELSSLPSLSVLPLYKFSGYPKPRSSAKLPSLQFSDHKIGYSVRKRANLRYSYNSAQNNLLHISRTSDGEFWCYFNHGYGLNRSYYNGKSHYQNKLSRDIVARSELAGIGTSDGAYYTPGFHEMPFSHSPITVFLFPLILLTPAPSQFYIFFKFRNSEIKLASKLRGVCFYVVTAISAISLIWLMVVAHPFVLMFDRYRREAQHFVAKLWATSTVAPFFKIEIEGLENLPPQDAPAVYVSNHQSFLDIYTLITLGRSFKFISKTSIFLYPIIGWAMSFMGVIPLKRMDSRSQLECLKKCMDLIRNDASVFFFPEGTRSKDGKLGVFKKGAFSVAVKTGVPVVPITLIGTGKIMPTGMEGVINSGSVKVVIHKPIEGSDPALLCEEARNIIADTLKHHD